MIPPNPQTNLTDKFKELSTKVANLEKKIDALMGVGPDNITGTSIADLKTAITSLMGIGPENTLKSINQSIWNLAGPAPGKSLLDLHTLLQNIYAQWDGGAGLTAYNLLDTIYLLLVTTGTTQTEAKNILARLIAQFDTSVVTPTMKDLMLTLSQQQAQLVGNTANPLTKPPPDVCESPLVSTGNSYSVISAAVIEAYTVATWSQDPGGDFNTLYGVLSLAYSSISCTNWSAYRVYVASNADSFGLAWMNPHMYPCNQWITLDFTNDTFDFFVLGDKALKVYICPASNPPVLGACAGATDQLTVTDWYHPTPEQQQFPARDTWYALAWAGGGTWSELTSFYYAGGDMFGFNPTVANTTLHVCFEWDVSAEPTCTEVGIHAWLYAGGWAPIYIGWIGDVVISYAGTAGNTEYIIDMSEYVPPNSNLVFLPYVAFNAVHNTTPNVSIKLSYIA